MKINNILIIFLGSFSMLRSDGSCLGIHILNTDTYAYEQGPLQFMKNCPCSCNRYQWTENGMCPICLHRHADGKTFGQQQITLGDGWIKSLIAYTNKLNTPKKNIPLINLSSSQAKDVYGNPEGGMLGNEGIPGDWWGEGDSFGDIYGESQNDGGGFTSLLGGGGTSESGGLFMGF